MRILITGNMGYVGPAVVRRLRATYPEAELIGYDTGFFAHCLTNADRFPEVRLSRQTFGDIRDIDDSLLRGCDAVVHLAGISNDPMGNTFARVTREINQDASLRLAQMAVDAKVGAFVFASSCSVYGIAQGPARRESDSLDPITAYAQSKIGTEIGLRASAGEMTVTCLRFATACGMSDRLRLDLVLNDFVAGAIACGEIAVLSDGTPWRPLIDTADMARAIDWAIRRDPENGGEFLAVNVGRDEANYQVTDLAQAVAEAVPDVRVSINRDAPVDSRSYKVDFELFRRLAPGHQPEITLRHSIAELVDGLGGSNFADADYRKSQMIRLNVLSRYRERGVLDDRLRWRNQE